MAEETPQIKLETAKRVKRLQRGMTIALVGIIALSALVWFVRASEVSNRKDLLSNQTAGQLSSHQISFNLTGGNTLAAGEQVVIDFQEDGGGFIVSGSTMTVNDFDFRDQIGAADHQRTVQAVTLGAPNCTGYTGTDDVVVGIDDAAGIITFEACSNYTASDGNSEVRIFIGSNSGKSGAVDRITNPATPQNVTIMITEAAGECSSLGDTCGIGVPVVDSDEVSITATVPGDGGGGGGTPPADTTPPVISNIRCTDITNNSVIFRFDTDEASTTEVRYGLTTAYGQNYSDGAYVLAHSAPVYSLQEAATYHYSVRAMDSANNLATWSADHTCTTLDETPPAISNVQCSPAENSLTFTWDTDESATSYVDYDLDGSPYDSTEGTATPLVTSHSVTVSGLSSGTSYHYRVRSGDDSGNEGFTSDATCVTSAPADSTPPVISNIQVTNVTVDSATVTWDTDESATSFVDYDQDGSPYDSTEGTASPLETSHSVTLTGLSENTVYHYSVRSADSVGNSASSADATFQTADGTPPVISNIQVSSITATTARITWDTDEAADSLVDYGLTTGYGSQESDATLVTSHQIDLSGLNPNSTYNFQVTSADGSGNSASSANQTFQTTLPPPPVISNVRATNITQTSARIEWDTTTNSDSLVDYGLTTAYGEQGTNATMATSHVVLLTGLAKGTTYHYQVTSEDAYGQSATSGDNTFDTVADTTPPANVTNFTATAGDAQIQLDWDNPTDADFQGVKILRKTSGYPTGSGDGIEVYDGAGTSHLDTTVSNGITYYYGAFAYDDVPNYASGAVASATPEGPPDTTPPGEISNFTATPGDTVIDLTWTNPTDADFAGVQIVRKSGSCPTSRTDGTVVYDGTGEAKTDAGLANGQLYCYVAFTYDGVPNWSSGVSAQATPVAPPDTAAPGEVTNLTATAGDAQIQLAWDNPTDADWAGTRLVRKAGSPPLSITDGTIVFDGAGDSQLDTGLTNGTTYHYTAFTYDLAGNYSNGVTVSATPQAALPPPPPPACTDTDGGKVYSVKGTVSDTTSVNEDSCASSSSVMEWFCSAGTGQNEIHECGSGYRCSAGTCVVETYQPTATVCGDGTCEGSENNINCAVDCPVTPVAPPVQEPTEPTVAPEQELELSDLRFYATAGRIRLRLSGEQLRVYTGMTFTVYIPDESIRKPIKSAFINFAGSSFALKQTNSYEAAIKSPPVVGTYPLDLLVTYEDGTSDKVSASVLAVARGDVYESGDGGDRPVSNARVTLLVDTGGGNFGLWDAGPSGQRNPQSTGENGLYSFIVPPGTYKLVAEKEDYHSKTTLSIPIGPENVITRRLQIIKKPEKTIIEAITEEDAKVSEVVKATTEQVTVTTKQATEAVKEVVQSPKVEQQAKTVAAPAAAAVAVANVVTVGTTAATGIPYLMYLISFLAHPTLLFGRRKRKKWGVVFNSLSKVPVDLAIVRLLDAKTERVLRSAVTDKQGRYVFIVQPGEYKLAVAKAGFVFPTAYMADKKEGTVYVDIYHGEKIEVEENTAITANIPVDPVEKAETPRQVVWAGIARRFQKSLGVLSILAMVVVTVISPTVLMFAMLGGNIVIYLLFRRLSVSKKPKNWGIVYDKKSGKPLRNAVARVFESKYNKLLDTQVTDSRGRYSFLVGQNIYYVVFEKPGYQKQQKGPVDLTQAEEGVVAVDVALEPVGKGKEEPGAAEPGKKPPAGAAPPTPSEKKSVDELLAEVPESGKKETLDKEKVKLKEEAEEAEPAAVEGEAAGEEKGVADVLAQMEAMQKAQAEKEKEGEEGGPEKAVPEAAGDAEEGAAPEAAEAAEKGGLEKAAEKKAAKSELPWELQALQKAQAEKEKEDGGEGGSEADDAIGTAAAQAEKEGEKPAPSSSRGAEGDEAISTKEKKPAEPEAKPSEPIQPPTVPGVPLLEPSDEDEDEPPAGPAPAGPAPAGPSPAGPAPEPKSTPDQPDLNKPGSG